MVHGDLSGHVGKLYIYYKGPQRIVLSDVSGPQYASGNSSGVSTGLRVVLFPNDWTEVDFATIRDKWETGTSQLNYLDKDGWVDIYTDPEEVAHIKRSQGKPDERLRDGLYRTENETQPAAAPKQEVTNADGFVMPVPKQKYFDLNNFPKPVENAPAQPETTAKPNIDTVSTSNPEVDKLLDIIQKQYAQSAKQSEQLGKMVETTQQLVNAVLASLSMKKE